jgi:hypothetical protein
MTSLPQFPTIDLSHLDAAQLADKATAMVRDGLYITVGVGVLGAQQIAEFAQQSAKKWQDAIDQGKQNTEKMNQQVRNLVGKAA